MLQDAHVLLFLVFTLAFHFPVVALRELVDIAVQERMFLLTLVYLN